MIRQPRIEEMQRLLDERARLLRALAAFLDGAAVGQEFDRVVFRKMAERVRLHLNPRRGFAEGRRGR